MKRILRAAVLAPLIAASASACAYSNSAITGARRAYGFSWQDELRIGREMDPEIVDEYGLYEDSALAAYVARVGDTLVAVSHVRRPTAPPEWAGLDFTFRVLDTDAVNAFAVPGGYVYVTRGMLAHLDNEAQLAVVMGHEVAHVAARHSAQDALKASIAIIGVLTAAMVSELSSEGSGEAVASLGSGAMNLVMLGHSRDDERESDRLGIEYATLAGYRAEEGARFFDLLERMRMREGSRTPEFLSTHPDPGAREETVEELARSWATRAERPLETGRESFARAVDGMVLGRDPRRGVAQGGTFSHVRGGFAFDLPPGWDPEWSEGRFAVTLPGERAAIVFRPRHRPVTAVEAAEEWVARMGLSGIVRSGRSVEGFPVEIVYGERGAAGDHADAYRYTESAFLEANGRVYQLIGIARSGALGEMRAGVEAVVRTLRPLTDKKALAMEPVRLRFVTTEAEAAFRSLVTVLPEGMEVEDVALLNRVAPDDVVPAGTTLKQPRRTTSTGNEG